MSHWKSWEHSGVHDSRSQGRILVSNQTGRDNMTGSVCVVRSHPPGVQRAQCLPMEQRGTQQTRPFPSDVLIVSWIELGLHPNFFFFLATFPPRMAQDLQSAATVEA